MHKRLFVPYKLDNGEFELMWFAKLAPWHGGVNRCTVRTRSAHTRKPELRRGMDITGSIEGEDPKDPGTLFSTGDM